MVLVSMHATSKEIDDWTWQTPSGGTKSQMIGPMPLTVRTRSKGCGHPRSRAGSDHRPMPSSVTP